MIYSEYVNELKHVLDQLDPAAMEHAVQTLRDTYESGGTIFVMGNGGSAATANHFAADFEKNSVKNGGPRPRILSLASAAEKILAYGNDVSFDRVFSEQLDALGKAGDTAVFISASGNSPDIVCAMELAAQRGIHTIGLSGFGGGYLREHADVSLHAAVDSYEIAEDMHSIFLHMIVCRFKEIYKAPSSLA